MAAGSVNTAMVGGCSFIPSRRNYVARPGPGFMIYSEILPDPDPEEREPSLENYRFTQSYSQALPEGEPGEIHVSTIEAILSRTQFEEARGRGW